MVNVVIGNLYRKRYDDLEGAENLDVGAELYYWITVANESRERFGLAPGIIENLVAHLNSVLGPEFLASLLEQSKKGAGIMSESVNPLRAWLHGPSVEKHVIQLLEFAALLKSLEADSYLQQKIRKLKQDAQWPVMFELAMASRLKSSMGSEGVLGLCGEISRCGRRFLHRHR